MNAEAQNRVCFVIVEDLKIFLLHPPNGAPLRITHYYGHNH